MPNPPVSDWSTDYDVFDAGYVEQPFPIWDELRATCPIAHTERWGGSWLPTRYTDVAAIAHDVEHFSSRNVSVVPPPEDDLGPGGFAVPVPPIDCDPPVHTWTRRLLLPWFSHKRVAEYEPITRDLCNSLIDGFIDRGRADAAGEYAQQIPARVIALTLGVPGDMADTFTGWVRDVLEFAHDEERRNAGRDAIAVYLMEQMEERRGEPGDDLISALLTAEIELDGERRVLTDMEIQNFVVLLSGAGVETVARLLSWAGVVFARNPEQRAKVVANPGLVAGAVEELLRYEAPSPVNGRFTFAETEFQGVRIPAGSKVLMLNGSANRDPREFDRPDQFDVERRITRHISLGYGTHFCLGASLARLETRVALEETFARFPAWDVVDDELEMVRTNTVRGYAHVPIHF